ncbi:MAG TPA: amidohydrolase family protein [Thermoplasmata archaeon]|nr:amidohydrolase family protein [Thermoplasmata archaeon]
MIPDALAIERATVLADPDAPPRAGMTIVVEDGRISRIGPHVEVPRGARRIDANQGFVVAGFWNAHVHFTEPSWNDAARAAPGPLDSALRAMLTSHGFTSVVDTGSDPRITIPLRRRIVSGELAGPNVRTAGPSIFPADGIPYYLADSLPEEVRPLVPQPATPEAAAETVREIVALGADVIKIFTGSYVARGEIRHMPEPVARAAVEAAHRAGRLVYSHPSDGDGVRIALGAGVDILAHPPDTVDGPEGIPIRALVERGARMTPTLSMFARTVRDDDAYLEPIRAVVREFHRQGGQLIFGTDVGYMPDPTVDREVAELVRCGLAPREVLRALTTRPAETFGVGEEVGALRPGFRGDLAVLDGDPIEDPSAFSRVRATVRSGAVLYERP